METTEGYLVEVTSLSESAQTSMTTEAYNEYYDIYGFTSAQKQSLIVYCVICSLLTFSAVFGNVIAIIVFIVNRKRALQQLYLLNLAVSDLLVGLIVLIPYCAYSASYLTMPFSHVPCVIIHVCDVMLTAESSITMVLISYDRYLLVTAGAHYSNKESQTKVLSFNQTKW